MIKAHLYKGIEFVVLDELPADQKESIIKTLSPEHLIKILVDGVVVSNCILKKDYQYWLKHIFGKSEKEIIKGSNLPTNVETL